jgi:hypothetical protein
MKKEKPILGAGVVCWSCKHFQFAGSTGGYSEVTPGDSEYLRCGLYIWDLYFDSDSQADMERKMKTAETCDKFESR